jgi:hypothetical protein
VNRKLPALTSPWKVGFLVALLLVVTALGVSYFISGTFGVAWHWIKVGGLSPTTWSFNFGAFIDEMVPLLLLTSALAFAAYGLVAGAVRRYKAYVDSGVEYKQLLRSIKSIDDLEDEQLVDALKQHPELREFMMSMKNRVAAAERQQAEGGRRRGDAGAAKRGPERETLGSECGILASAMMNGRDGFAGELALTIPELKQVERAMRKHFADQPPARAAADPARGELEAMRSSVRGAVASVRRDVDACVAGAREVESSLTALRQGIEALAASPSGGDGVAAAIKQVDATAGALAMLGEETRRIAIAAALQASGGAEGESIQVADEVRTVATRFNTVAQQWKQFTRALEAAAGGSRPVDQTRAALIAAAGAAANKASLWSERAAALVEQVRGIERAAGVETAADTRPAEKPAPRWEAADEEIEVPAPPPVFSPQAAEPGPSEDFVARGPADVFATATGEDTPFADIPGFEKEHRFFGETETGEADSAKHDGDGLEVEGHQREDWSLDESATADATEVAEAPRPAAAAPPADSDGFLTGPRPAVAEPLLDADRVDPKATKRSRAAADKPAPVAKAADKPAPAAKPAAKPAPAPKAAAKPAPAPKPAAKPAPAAKPVAATEILEPEAGPDADAFDLYALGAVDYVDA